jgi:hypothetical protein
VCGYRRGLMVQKHQMTDDGRGLPYSAEGETPSLCYLLESVDAP